MFDLVLLKTAKFMEKEFRKGFRQKRIFLTEFPDCLGPQKHQKEDSRDCYLKYQGQSSVLSP